MRHFTLDEANDLLPEASRRVSDLAAMQRRLIELARAAEGGEARGVIPEAKALDAQLHEGLAWFEQQGIHVKGIAPALLDFPARLDDDLVLLCWLQGEPQVAWYHAADVGFAGREPIAGSRL